MSKPRSAPLLNLPPDIEAAMPPHGPCGLCGGPDARHRVIDAIASRVRAGDSEEDVAADYGYSVEVVDRIVACWDEDTQRWLAPCTHRRLRQITHALMQCEDCGAELDS